MGKKVYRKGLISNPQLKDLDVIIDFNAIDEFSVALLEQYLQVNYPDSKIIEQFEHSMYQGMMRLLITIRFSSKEDSLHFHLSHQED